MQDEKKKSPQHKSELVWGSGTWKRLRARASTCADICLKVSLLPSPAVPHFICLSALGFHTDDEGPRCSAMRYSSNPLFFDTWQIINIGPAVLNHSSEWAEQIRHLTGHIHTDKNLLLAVLYEAVPSFISAVDLEPSKVFVGLVKIVK